MKEFVEYTVRCLVDDASVIEVELVPEGGEKGEDLINILCPPAEIGRIIGKQGKNIKAIRTIVRSAAGKGGKRYNVEVIEK